MSLIFRGDLPLRSSTLLPLIRFPNQSSACIVPSSEAHINKMSAYLEEFGEKFNFRLFIHLVLSTAGWERQVGGERLPSAPVNSLISA